MSRPKTPSCELPKAQREQPLLSALRENHSLSHPPPYTPSPGSESYMIKISIPCSAILIQQTRLEVRGVITRTLVDRIHLISLGIQESMSEASCFQTIPCKGGNPPRQFRRPGNRKLTTYLAVRISKESAYESVVL